MHDVLDLRDIVSGEAEQLRTVRDFDRVTIDDLSERTQRLAQLPAQPRRSGGPVDPSDGAQGVSR